jgi:prepilin-type N-terminal cleavage/methylation domain-containing protein
MTIMRKHGFTLVELLAVMAVMAVVMGFTVVLLVQLFDHQQRHDEYTEQTRSLNRLVVDFRSDVRTYGKPQIPADGTALLRWTTDTKTIDYTAQPGEFPDQLNLVRTVRIDGQDKRSEIYRLPDKTTVHFADGTGNDAGLLALSLWTTPQGTPTPNLDELNPFDRTIPKNLEQKVNPKYAANWRTILARY